MRNLFQSLFPALLGVVLGAGLSWADVHISLKPEMLSFDNLKEFNIQLTGSEKGVSSYSGLKDELRLNFTVEENEVTKIIVLFDFDTSEAERAADVMETINIADNLMPQKINSLTEVQDKLYKKLAKMKYERDTDIFMIDSLRFECAMNNGVVNIRITK